MYNLELPLGLLQNEMLPRIIERRVHGVILCVSLELSHVVRSMRIRHEFTSLERLNAWFPQFVARHVRSGGQEEH